jgi:hypothetical protein
MTLGLTLASAAGCDRGAVEAPPLVWSAGVEDTDPWRAFHTSREGASCTRQALQRLEAHEWRLRSSFFFASECSLPGPVADACTRAGFPAEMAVSGAWNAAADATCEVLLRCRAGEAPLAQALRDGTAARIPLPEPARAGDPDLARRATLPVRLMDLHAARDLAHGREREAARLLRALLLANPVEVDPAQLAVRGLSLAGTLKSIHLTLDRGTWQQVESLEQVAEGLRAIAELPTGMDALMLERWLGQACALPALHQDEWADRGPREGACRTAGAGSQATLELPACLGEPGAPWAQGRRALLSPACAEEARAVLGAGSSTALGQLRTGSEAVLESAALVFHARALAVFAGAWMLHREGQAWPPDLAAAAARAGVPLTDPLSGEPMQSRPGPRGEWCLHPVLDPALLPANRLAGIERCVPGTLPNAP